MEELLSRLNERERWTLYLRHGIYYGRCYSNKEISKILFELGLTKKLSSDQNIGKIAKEAMAKLRTPRKLERIREYLD